MEHEDYLADHSETHEDDVSTRKRKNTELASLICSSLTSDSSLGGKRPRRQPDRLLVNVLGNLGKSSTSTVSDNRGLDPEVLAGLSSAAERYDKVDTATSEQVVAKVSIGTLSGSNNSSRSSSSSSSSSSSRPILLPPSLRMEKKKKREKEITVTSPFPLSVIVPPLRPYKLAENEKAHRDYLGVYYNETLKKYLAKLSTR